MDVVALGELLIDFTTTGTDSSGYPTMAAHPGGAPANFLAALASFGFQTALLGKVGTDMFGQLLIDTLERKKSVLQVLFRMRMSLLPLPLLRTMKTGSVRFPSRESRGRTPNCVMKNWRWI